MKFRLFDQLFGGRGATSGGGGGGGSAGGRGSSSGTGKVSINDAQTALEDAFIDDPEFGASARAVQWNNTLAFDIKNSVDRNGETVDEAITRAKKLTKEQAKLRFGEYQGYDNNGDPYFVKKDGRLSYGDKGDILRDNKSLVTSEVAKKSWGKGGDIEVSNTGIVTVTSNKTGFKPTVRRYLAEVTSADVRTTIDAFDNHTRTFTNPKVKFRAIDSTTGSTRLRSTFGKVRSRRS